MNEEIVITGAEIVTCLGATREETWRAVAAGRCGIGPLSALESPLDGAVGGQAVALPTEFAANLPREVRYLKWTIERALAEAGALDSLPYPVDRCGFMLGTTLHGMRQAGAFLRSGDFAPLGQFLAGNTLELAIAKLRPTGFAATTCSACSSSLGSVSLGATMLRSGEFDLIVCGGYDTISEYAYGGFNSLRLVAAGPLRPFAKERQGMKLGEGYGIVVLERIDGAQRRGAKILARVLGFGESADAHHLTQPHPQGEGAARAMAEALKSAGIEASDIGLIAAHATGTPDNDAAEYAALARVFGEQLSRVPVVGFKSHLGHTLGGAGAVEMILAMMALREQVVPPCANVSSDEVEFAELNLSTGEARRAEIGTTLSTSLGFGGANTCVVLGGAAEIRRPSPRPSPGVPGEGVRRGRDVLITGIGVIVPGAIGNEAFLRLLKMEAGEAARGGAIAEEEFVHLLNARRVRRMSEQVKLTLAATAVACQHAGIADIAGFARDCGAILASQHGSSNYSHAYYSEIVKQGLLAANPMLFAEGVPNACSAHLSLMLGVKGPCQTIIGTRTAGLDALRLASMRIASGEWDRAIVGAAEEQSEIIDSAYDNSGLRASGEGTLPFVNEDGFVTGSASVTLVLESRESMEVRGGRAYGRIVGGASARGSGGEIARACQQVLSKMGSPRQIISSANGTWIDRAELAGIRQSCAGGAVTSMYGYIAESFSAGPLIGIAATLLGGKLVQLRGDGLAGVRDVAPASGGEKAEEVAALATDYSGVVSAVKLKCENT